MAVEQTGGGAACLCDMILIWCRKGNAGLSESPWITSSVHLRSFSIMQARCGRLEWGIKIYGRVLQWLYISLLLFETEHKHAFSTGQQRRILKPLRPGWSKELAKLVSRQCLLSFIIYDGYICVYFKVFQYPCLICHGIWILILLIFLPVLRY